MNNGTDFIEIPVKDSLKVRAIVIAGFANDVEEVKMYAAPIHAETITADMDSRF